MKIILAAPLYPPEIAESALYVKELARRLGKEHEITIVTYTHLPEKVPGVRIIAVNKRRPLLVRLFLYTIALARASRDADVIYAQNGASVELPALLVAMIRRRPLIIHLGDETAHRRAAQSALLRNIEHFALRRACTIITDIPMKRPEILPFEPIPAAEFTAYCTSWDTHIRTLNNALSHV